MLGRNFAGCLKHDHTADRLRRTDKEADALVVLERTLGPRPDLKAGVEPAGREFQPLVRQNVAAFGLNFLGADSYVQNLFYGGGLVVAVSISQLVRKRQAMD